MNVDRIIFYHLGVALAIGILIGIERGWKQRREEEGDRIAGIRTFGLLGLLGGTAMLLGNQAGRLVVGLIFIGLSVLFAVVYRANLDTDDEDVGITSMIAGLLTFLLGALAVTGEVALAAAGGVVTALILSYKPVLHRWVSVLERDELRAGIKLLLISVVVLPVLPNQGYGPWQSLNPFTIWWMVVLISTISFVGYFAIKLGGARWGAALTGLFAGMASSTALTLHFSRAARDEKSMVAALSTGILVACATMYPRTLLVAGVINPNLLSALWLPFLVMALTAYPAALFYWRCQSEIPPGDKAPMRNPLALRTAVGFGLLLSLVFLLSNALKAWYGDAGILALAAVSGVSDVDPITLSLAKMSGADLNRQTAATGIVIAAAVNSLCKGGMAWAVGGHAVGLRVGLPLLASAMTGLAAAWFALW